MIRYMIKKEWLTGMTIAMFLLTSIYLINEFKGSIEGLSLTTKEAYDQYLESEEGLLPFGDLFLGMKEAPKLINAYYEEQSKKVADNPYLNYAYSQLATTVDALQISNMIFSELTINKLLYHEISSNRKLYDFSDEAVEKLFLLSQSEDKEEHEMILSQMYDTYPVLYEWVINENVKLSREYYTTMNKHRNVLYKASGTTFDDYQDIVEETLQGTTISEQYARKFASNQMIVWGLFVFLFSGFQYMKYQYRRSKLLLYSQNYSSGRMICELILTQIGIVIAFTALQMLLFALYIKFGIGEIFLVSGLDFLLVYLQVCIPTLLVFIVTSNIIMHGMGNFQFGFPLYFVLFVFIIGDSTHNYQSASPLVRHDIIHALTQNDYTWLLWNRGGYLIVSLIGIYAIIKIHYYRRIYSL